MRVTTNIELGVYKKYIFIFFVCIFYLQTSGGTVTSTAAGGLWSVGGSWSGGVAPIVGDDVIINCSSGNSVTYDLATNPAISSLTINSGSLILNAAASGTKQLTTTDLTITGGTLDLSTSSSTGVGVLWVKGNFIFSSGTVKATTNTNNYITCNGITTQTLNATASFGSNFTLRIFNNAIVQIQSVTTITGSCKFTVDAGGTLGVTATDGISSSGLTGQVQVSGTRSFASGSSYIYNGSSAQVTGNGLPASIKNLTINNSAGVSLSASVSLTNAASVLTLTNGILTTSPYLLTISGNTATSAIAGPPSTSNYVNGPMALKLAMGSNYTFPVGKGGTYLPFTINPTSVGTSTIQVEAYSTNCGGSVNTPLTSLSPSEYWEVNVTLGNITSANIGLYRQTAVNSGSAIGNYQTTSPNSPIGPYSSIGGTVGTNSITVNNAPGLALNSRNYYVIASTTTCSPSLTHGSNEPVVASQCAGNLRVSVQSFTLTFSDCGGNLTDVSFTTTGTFAQSDIVRYQLYSNSSNNILTATQLGANLIPTGGNGTTEIFAAFGSPIFSGVYPVTFYFWITADIASSAANNSTISVNGISISNLTTSPTSTSSTTNAGGIQTIKANPTTAYAGTNQSQCNNGSFTLAGNTPTVGTGAWSCFSGCAGVTITTPSSNTSGVTGVAAGTPAVLTWTISNSPCTASSSNVTLTNNPTNAVSVSINASPSGAICAGTNVGFTATPTNGGTTPAYQWKKNGSNVGANSNTYSDAGLANGDQITCVLTSNVACPSGNPATSNTITMTVNALPTVSATATPATVCQGSSTTLSASPTGALTYAWSSGCVGNVATCSIIPGASATYTVTLTDANNCTATSSTSVTVNTIPPALSVTVSATPNSINIGNSTTLSASPTGGGGPLSYAWSSGCGGSVATCAASPATSTTFTVTVTDNATCGSTATNSVAVTVITSTNNSNVSISGAATSGGNWSNGNPDVFTPTSDNANILYSELQTKLLTKSVTIITANAGGHQNGDVTFSNNVSVTSTSATKNTFTINVGGAITVNTGLTFSFIGSSGALGNPGINLNFNAGTNVNINSAITTSGGSSGNDNPGGNAGAVTINAPNGNVNCSNITSNGGLAGTANNDVATAYGGTGGNININTTTGGNVTIGNISNIGGTSSANSPGAVGGSVSIKSTTGYIQCGTITSTGSNAGTKNDDRTSDYGGAGGAITLDATGGTNVTVGTIINSGGDGSGNQYGGIGGTITINAPTGIVNCSNITSNGGSSGTKNDDRTTNYGGAGGNIIINSTTGGNVTTGNISNIGGASSGNMYGAIGGSVTIKSTTGYIQCGSITSKGSNAGTKNDDRTLDYGGVGGAITLDATGGTNVTVGAILNSGGDGSGNEHGGDGGIVSIKATGYIQCGSISTTGGNAGTKNDVRTYSYGGAGGAITLNATGGTNVIVGGAINNYGGNSSANIYGGAGGNVNITAPGSFSTSNNITTKGGNCGTLSNQNQNGGQGGTITVLASAVSITGGVTLLTTGGARMGVGTSVGGAISLTGSGATGGLTLACNITTTGATTNGNITINDGNGIVTSGGVNDGLTSGLIDCGTANFTKTGIGNFRIGTTASEVVANTSNVILSGGGLQSSGVSGSTETMGTLKLTANANIYFGSTMNSHELHFAATNNNAGGTNWNTQTLFIQGWQGTAGSSGTAGRIFVGTSATDLTNPQKVSFHIGSNYYLGMQLSTGEIVPSALLPVELIQFNALLKNSTVLINWTTATETNNDYFIVYKSTDGIHFEELQRVKGAGNTTQTKDYSIEDDNPVNGINYYYLKQIDFNGKEESFPVKELLYKSGIKSLDLMIFPNPVSNKKISFILTGIDDELIEMDLKDMLGRIYFTDNRIVKNNQVETIDFINEIPSGIYLFTVISHHQVISRKIIVE